MNYNKVYNSLTTSVLIRFIFTFGFAITEQFLIHTFTITTREFTLWTDRFISLQDWFHFTWLYLHLFIDNVDLEETNSDDKSRTG